MRFAESLAASIDIDNDNVSEIFVGVPDFSSTTQYYPVGSIDVYSGRTGNFIFRYTAHPITGAYHIGTKVVSLRDPSSSAQKIIGLRGIQEQIDSVLIEFAITAGMSNLSPTRELRYTRRSISNIANLGDHNGDGADDLGVVYLAKHNNLSRFYKSFIDILDGRTLSLIRTLNGPAGEVSIHATVTLQEFDDIDQDGFRDLLVNSDRFRGSRVNVGGSVQIVSGLDGHVISEIYEASTSWFVPPTSGKAWVIEDLNNDGIREYIVDAYDPLSGGARPKVFSPRPLAAASSAALGVGCASSNVANLSVSSPNLKSRLINFNLTQAAANQAGMLLISSSVLRPARQISPGCNLHVAVPPFANNQVAALPFVTNSRGEASVNFNLLNIPKLAGAEWGAQAVLLDPVNSFALSNALSMSLGY